MKDYRKYLDPAIDLAEETYKNGNHPCGSIIINQDETIIASSGNKVFSTPDITAHAEMLCIRNSSNLLLNDNDQEYILFSSHEPCCGCAFFIARTNIKKIIYACSDKYRPGISMLKNDKRFKEYFNDIEMIIEPYLDLRNRSAALMKDYFLKRNRPEPAKFFASVDT